MSSLLIFVVKLAVDRCTLGYASVEAMLSQLSRASCRGSLSLFVPLPMPRLKQCSLSSIEPRSEARCRLLSQLSRASFRDSLIQGLAVARCTLGYASAEAMISELYRASFRVSLAQRLAVARCTLGYASVKAMLSQFSRALFPESVVQRLASACSTLAMPWSNRCFLGSLKPCSETRCRSLYSWLCLG